MFIKDYASDYRYSAIRMVTKLDFKAINELENLHKIKNYRELADLDRIKEMDRFELSESTCRKLDGVINSWDLVLKTADEYREIAKKNNIFVISVLDSEFYPYNWRGLSGMPKVIYCRGRKEILRNLVLNGAVAIVGSREASKYALFATESFATELSNKGIVVVSGMASGVDRAAHSAAVRHKGSTVAVVPGGPERIYPRENRDIYEQIVCDGLVISEMPPGQNVLKQYFPARNRLIAGLGDCTLIMEAGEVSGTLHTASFTAAQGKEVFVLPNSIYFENAKGGMKLLEDGGNVLISPDSVIDSISQAQIFKRIGDPYFFEGLYESISEKEAFEQKAKADIDDLRKQAEMFPEEVGDAQWKLLISDELSSGPKNIDELCRALALPFYRISQLLVDMKLEGWITDQCGKFSLTIC
ncbi:MAG: DNA-processing protein DprA [Clostridiales bacterium]|nr:DNA-processing protein DprA [Clostridiales bacterium]